MEELKPCPFCRKLPTLYENKMNLKEILYEYGCFGGEHHSCSVGFFKSEYDAREAWNNSVQPR